MDTATRLVLGVEQCEGSVHDFQLYKERTGRAILSDITVWADSGYQGLVHYHANSEIPFKKRKNCPLSSEEKASNCRLSRERVVIEHVNRQIKVFKMMSDRYRNRRRRHGLRMTLICAVRNREIILKAG